MKNAISSSENDRTKNVWTHFNKNNLTDFHDLNFNTDALLVKSKLRYMNLNDSKLVPYISIAWTNLGGVLFLVVPAGEPNSRIKLVLFRDMDMRLFVEICSICQENMNNTHHDIQ